MNPLMWIRLGGIAAVLAILTGLYFYIEKSGYERRVAEDNAEIIQATKENDTLKAKLGEQHAQAEAALNTILSIPAPRLRPTCPSGESNPAAGSQVSLTASERANLGSQEVLDRLTGRLDAKAAEWSRALIACKTVMEWAKAQ